jgi:DUF4097 and DUF4098 domain-containing protein YvlB
MKRLISAFWILFGPALWAATVTEEKSFDARGLQEVAVANVNGDIEIHCVPGDVVRLKAVKTAGRESQLKSIEVKATASPGKLSIETEHARSYLFGILPLKTGGRVDYLLEVPPGVALTLDTVNGDIKAKGAARSLTAATVNGNVEAEAFAGKVHLESVNGSITLVLKDPVPQTSLETVNGGITVIAPESLDARFAFETVSGDIRFLPERFKVKGRGAKEIEGMFGSGKGELAAETVNGTITVHLKGPAAV